jgi:hypothetical protein
MTGPEFTRWLYKGLGEIVWCKKTKISCQSPIKQADKVMVYS